MTVRPRIPVRAVDSGVYPLVYAHEATPLPADYRIPPERPPIKLHELDLYVTMRCNLTCEFCNVRAGDILACGTISGPGRASWGCLLELTWNGTRPIALSDGTQRGFLEDGDIIEMRGWTGNHDSADFGVIRNPIFNNH